MEHTIQHIHRGAEQPAPSREAYQSQQGQHHQRGSLIDDEDGWKTETETTLNGKLT